MKRLLLVVVIGVAGCSFLPRHAHYGPYPGKFYPSRQDFVPTFDFGENMFRERTLGDVLQSLGLDFQALRHIWRIRPGPDGGVCALLGLAYYRLDGEAKEEVIIWLDSSKILYSQKAEWTYDQVKNARVRTTSKEYVYKQSPTGKEILHALQRAGH